MSASMAEFEWVRVKTRAKAKPVSTAPEESQDTREQLLDTAARLMRENDTIDVSLSELSRASGLNSALVKYYFGNKAGLMRSLLEREMVPVLEGIDWIVASEYDPETKLRRHIGKVVDKFYEVPFIQLLLMRLIREAEPDDAERMADKYLRPIYDAYDRMISQGVEQGVFRPIDSQLFYFTLIGSADRFFAARELLKHCFGEDSLTEELRDRYRAHAEDFIMAGLLKTDV
jgi:AcrR family transcriptional regulator